MFQKRVMLNFGNNFAKSQPIFKIIPALKADEIYNKMYMYI